MESISQLAAYLHQDWADEYLESELDEEQLMEATVKLGIYYYPPGAGIMYREWLRDLEALLRAHG